MNSGYNKLSAGILIIFCCILPLNGQSSKIRTCFSCRGINCQRNSLTTQTEQCLDSLDYCVTIFDQFNVLRKGCYMTMPEQLRQRCDRNTAECHKCNQNRCNNLGQRHYACAQCDSSKDSNCASNPSSLTAVRCNAPLTPNSYCYVKYEGSTTTRGCATTLQEQKNCLSNNNCLLCLAGDFESCNNIDFTSATRSILMEKIHL